MKHILATLLVLISLCNPLLGHAGQLYGGAGGSGDVVGPSVSVDNGIVRYDGTTGKLLQSYTSNTPTCGDTGICTFVAPVLGTPTSGVATNLTGLPLTTGVSGILGSANGGTANGFTAFSGPTTSAKTFTLPNASDTIATYAVANTFTANQTINSSGTFTLNTTHTVANPTDTRSNFYKVDLSGTGTTRAIGTDSWMNSTTSFIGTFDLINFEVANRMGAGGGGGTPGTLTNSFLFLISDQVFNGYTITNSYGLYIASLAGTTKWGIYDASGGNWYNATGKLGLGTAPTTLLDLLGADNTTATTIKINATQANVTAADTFLDFRSTTGSEGSIAGTAVAGVIAYNTFTGSHYTQVEDADRASLQVGMLLEATGDAMTPTGKKTRTRTIPEKRHVDEKDGKETITPAQDIEETFEASHKPYLVKSRIARTKGSKAAYGVYGGTDKEGRDLVLALGTGLCYVTKTAKAIAVGDYLMASDVAGMMEVQADDVYRNSTVAKAMTNVAWAVGETSKQIPCIYLGG